MSAPDDDAAIREALACVLPGFRTDPGPFRYRLLDGGINKRSFLVSVHEQHYVLRRPVRGTSGLLDLATEAQVMKSAAAAGLAPRVVGADPSSGLLLTEYLAGALPWSAAIAREPHNIRRAAKLLRSLHLVPVALPKFAAAEVAERYVAALGYLEPEVAKWAEELTRLARDYDKSHAGEALCHNDLVAHNVLDDGGLMLVDFEYAVCGAPILDLAGLAGMNDYTQLQRSELLAAYYPRAAPFTAGQFDDMVRMVRLMAFFWALIGERQVADARAYSQFAARMVEALK